MGKLSGGNTSIFKLNGKKYEAHIFINSAVLTVNETGQYDILLVGPGGYGRGGWLSGGGAGGKVISLQKYLLSAGTYNVTIGTPGLPSSLGSLLSAPSGGSTNEGWGATSGSGKTGGGQYDSGGSSSSGGGGGGSEGNGVSGGPFNGGDGGLGLKSDITGTLLGYGGGGGGSANGGDRGWGQDGGGDGGFGSNGGSARVNSGGGSGGSSNGGAPGTPGNGIFVIRFEILSQKSCPVFLNDYGIY